MNYKVGNITRHPVLYTGFQAWFLLVLATSETLNQVQGDACL